MKLANLEFRTPGPGVWATDGLHGYKPATAIGSSSRFSMAFGFQTSASRYGSLVDGIKQVSINRFGYAQVRLIVSRPPGSEAEARKQFDAEVRSNPELKERFARAEETFATKRWRADIQFWDTVTRPWLLGRTLELTDLDPASMTDEGLANHIDDTVRQMSLASQHHHLLNMPNFSCRGLFVLNAADWTGLNSDQIEPVFVGSSPISAGDEPELRALTQAIRSDETAAELVAADDGAEDRIKTLMNRSGNVGKCAREFIRMVGMRTIVGWEPMNPYILEKPALLIGKVRHALEENYAQLDPDELAKIRDKVPDANRNDFDEQLAEARKYHRIRDERDIYCNMPVGGLMRRAVLEAGHRLCGKGVIDDAELMTEASAPEIRTLLLNDEGPSSKELRDRYEFRKDHSIEDVPAVLGAPDQIPVPADWLPEGARVFARMGILQAEGIADTESEGEVIKGRAASPGIYTGIARIIADASQLDQIQDGDVLVTTATNPAFNVVLPRVGAIVTQYGGLLSHAAIVAREFGLPAVVGCKKLLSKIESGSKITVDGDSGTVTHA
jgi:pyruvate,water dikinase